MRWRCWCATREAATGFGKRWTAYGTWSGSPAARRLVARRPASWGRFVTPELKQYEAKVLGAEERIAVREAELVDALRTRVADAVARVQTTAGIVAELDVWSGLADLAHRDAYVRPEVTAGFTIELEASRHPVVERMMAREAFIPNDVRLDEGGRVILLTGPNMAGKSTLLRQVGWCVLLAQTGSVVATRRAWIGGDGRLVT